MGVDTDKVESNDVASEASGLQVMINKKYSVGAELNNMRKNSELCDLIIRVNDADFQVHRNVLSAVSPYFKTLLLGDFTESKEKVVEIKEIEADIMKIIINYAYTSELVITESTAMALFVATDRFQVSYIRDEVGRYLKGHVCESNCIELYCLSELYNCLHLKEKSKNSFADIFRQENFLNLTSEMLIEFTSSDDLIVDREETVCEAVFLWYQFNPEERENDFDRVFETIRLALLDPGYLVNNVPKFLDINRLDLEKGRKLIRDVELYLLMPNFKVLPNHQHKHRKMVFNQIGLAIYKNIRILVNPMDRMSILCYDCVSESWRFVGCLARREDLLSLTLLDNSNLYAFYRYSVKRYCLKTNKWYDEPCDIEFTVDRRSTPTLASFAHRKIIYIIGSGQIFQYCPEQCTFRSYKFLQRIRHEITFNACAMDSYIYIVTDNERDVIRYNTFTGRLDLISPILKFRNECVGIAAKDGKIFVRGGGTDSVEVYDPHRNCWSFCGLDYEDKYPFNAPDEIQRKYRQ